MRLLIISCFISISFASNAQVPPASGMGSGLSNGSFKSVYIELISTVELSANPEKVIIRFGSGDIFEKLKKETLKYKDTGKLIEFSSAIDALNYLAWKGWIIRNSNVMPMGDKIVQHYLLEKYVDLSKYK